MQTTDPLSVEIPLVEHHDGQDQTQPSNPGLNHDPDVDSDLDQQLGPTPQMHDALDLHESRRPDNPDEAATIEQVMSVNPQTLDDTFSDANLFPGYWFSVDKVKIDEPLLVPASSARNAKSSNARHLKFSMKKDISKAMDSLQELAADVEAINYDIKCVKVLRQREQKSLPELRNKAADLKKELDFLYSTQASPTGSRRELAERLLMPKQKYKAACVEYEKCVQSINDCDAIIARQESALMTVQLRMDQLQTQNNQLKVLSQAIGASERIHKDEIKRERQRRAAQAAQSAHPIPSNAPQTKSLKADHNHRELEAQRAKAIRQRYNVAVKHIKTAKMDAMHHATQLAQRKEEAILKIGQDMKQIRRFSRAMDRFAINADEANMSPAEERRLAILLKLQREEAIAEKYKKKSTVLTSHDHGIPLHLTKVKTCNPIPSPPKPSLRLSQDTIVYPPTALGSSCATTLLIQLDAEDVDIRWPWAKIFRPNGGIKNEDETDEVRFEFRTPKLVDLEVYQAESDAWVDVLHNPPVAEEPRQEQSDVTVARSEDAQQSAPVNAGNSRGARDITSASSRKDNLSSKASPFNDESKESSQEAIDDTGNPPSSGKIIIQPWSWIESFPPPFSFYPAYSILHPGSQRTIDFVLNLPTPGARSGLPLADCGGAFSLLQKDQQIHPLPDENVNKPASAKKKKPVLTTPQSTVSPLADPLVDPPEMLEQKDWIKRLLAFKQARLTYEITCAITEAAAPASRLASLIAGVESPSEFNKQKRSADSRSKKARPDLILKAMVHIVRPDLVLFAPDTGILNFGEVPVDEGLCKKLGVQVLSEGIHPIHRFDKGDGCFDVDVSSDANEMWSKAGMVDFALIYKPQGTGTHRAIFGLHTPTTQMYVHLVGTGVVPFVELEPIGGTTTSDWISQPCFLGDVVCNDILTSTVFQVYNSGDVAAKVKVWIETSNEEQHVFKIVHPVEPVMLAAKKKTECILTFAPNVPDTDCTAFVCVEAWGQKQKYRVPLLGRSWISTAGLGGVETQMPTVVVHEDDDTTAAESTAAEQHTSGQRTSASNDARMFILRLPWIQESENAWKVQSKTISILNLKPNELKLDVPKKTGGRLDYAVEASATNHGAKELQVLQTASGDKTPVFLFDSMSGAVELGGRKDIIVTFSLNNSAESGKDSKPPTRPPTSSGKRPKNGASEKKPDPDVPKTLASPMYAEAVYKITVKGALGVEAGGVPEQVWNLKIITEMPLCVSLNE
ncbi:hypothetical protein SeLEV6574_g00879 [Synchytrium endobioticum]|nr:hypothetical protein SeLEV6574_g00879 [Synchytrium endobioticum]